MIVCCVAHFNYSHKVVPLIFTNPGYFRETHFVEFIELNAFFLAAASSNRGHI